MSVGKQSTRGNTHPYDRHRHIHGTNQCEVQCGERDVDLGIVSSQVDYRDNGPTAGVNR